MKLLLSLIFLYLIPGAALMFRNAFILLVNDHSLLWPLLSGFGAGTILYFIVIIRLNWLSTFEHEFTHALVALLFFRKINSFRVTSSKGGMVSHSGRFGGIPGDVMISLAPYFLPTLTMITIIIRIFLPVKYYLYADIMIGFTLAYHLFSNYTELITNWTGKVFQNAKGVSMTTDIKQSGYILSIITIISLSLYFYGLIIYFLTSGWNGIIIASKSTVLTSWNFYSKFFEMIKQSVLSF